jgi:WD40-like Beta Propeller Repeat
MLTACEQQINYPTPSPNITLSPSSIQAGQPSFTLTITGNGFTPASTVFWNSTTLVTLFTSISELTAQVPAGLVQNAGTASIVVSTPQPGGGNTLPATFTINAGASPLPQVTSLSPSGVSTGSGAISVTVNGKNFVAQSEVSVNGNLRSTAFQNSTSLIVSILSADVATAGSVPIFVINPPPSGGTSNTVSLNVKNPVPGLTSLSPAAAQAGTTTATAVTVAGTGFVTNSTVNINGAPHATTFTNSTELQITLTAADLVAGGVNQVQVFSPGPGGGTSNPLTFAVDPTDSAGLPVLVDLSPSGEHANNGVCGTPCTSGVPTLTTAGPSASLTGQFVAFASTSTNLLTTVTQPNNLTSGASGIFFRDTCLAATTSSSSSCTPRTLLISQQASGNSANGPSSEPSLDSAGANVAYTSTASNLVNYVATAGGARQVYWQPTCESTATSCTPVLVSLSADGTSAGNGESYNPVISPDGQYVAFLSLATNLVSGVVVDGVTPQIYIRTICSGATPQTQTASCVPTTYLVSTPDGVTPGDGPSSDPAISNTGLYVSFSSTATNLGATAPNPSGSQEIFERSTCVTTIGTTSNSCVPITNLVSTPDGGATPANGVNLEPAMSPDGRFVAFASTATDFGVASAGVQQVYVYDTCINVAVTTPPTCSPSSPKLVSTPDTTTSPSMPANSLSEDPSLSVCNATTTTTGTCPGGLLIAFATKSTNLAPNVVNGVENIFVRSTCVDLPSTTTACTPRTALASIQAGSSPAAANGDSIAPAISGDGHTVAFISSANNLVQIDQNGLADVFLGATSF